MTIFKVTKGSETFFFRAYTLNLSKAVRRLFSIHGDKIRYDLVQERTQ